MTELENRIEDCARMLLAGARESGLQLTGDRRISEGDAARLLSLHPATLKGMREDGTGPDALRVPVSGSRWSYRIDDLAAWIEVRRLNGVERGRTESHGRGFRSGRS